MNRARWRFVGVAFLILLTGKVVTAGGHRANSAADPELRLSTKSKTFHLGELIPLQLSFTSSRPKRYSINTASYDRSGRMNYEKFVVLPAEGTHDPLEVYFNSATAFVGGGITSFRFLSATPIQISLNLNEWVTFDKAGTYELRVVSNRVDDTQANNSAYGKTVDLESNSIKLRILPATPTWQQEQLASIAKALAQGRRSENYTPGESYWVALAELRYLGTKPAARELARQLRGENNNTDFECMFGLLGSPNRAAGLEEMNGLLEDSDFPISPMFLDTMAILPLEPSGSFSSLGQEREQNLSALYQRLATAVTNKKGKALAVSLDTLMSDSTGSMSAGRIRQLVPQLLQSFRLLPPPEQAQWLEYRWSEIKDPSWIPLLREAALHDQDSPDSHGVHAYESREVSAAALTRWYELDPNDARDTVIAEITRPKPRYNASVLGMLPDDTLPAAGQIIAQNFLSTDDFEIEGNLASLLFRYADASVMPEVLAKAGELVGDWACKPQDETLAYVLKFDPADAQSLIERAIEARGPDASACRHMIFTDIGALERNPVLETLAIASLNDPDLEVAANAAVYLGAYGSAAAEQALWMRYEEWGQTWAGRESELRGAFETENPHEPATELGQSLARALAAGIGWLADASMLNRIEALAVDENTRQEIDRDVQLWSTGTLTMNCIPSEPPSFSVAQYNLDSIEALKTKLKEFPTGTRFVVTHPSPTASPVELAAIKMMLDIATKDGLVVTRVPGASLPSQ